MRGRRAAAILGLALALSGPASGASALELSGFVSTATPGEVWRGGLGASLASNWFHVLSLEAEVAHQSGELQGQSCLSFTGSALLVAPIGKLEPYGGVGVGAARLETGTLGETHTLKAFVLGVRLHATPLFLLKAEYRSLSLPEDAALALDKRFSAGVGFSF